MRVWNVLKALHFCYDIHLLLVSSRPSSQPIPEKVQTICSRIFDFTGVRSPLSEKVIRRFWFYLAILANKVWPRAFFCILPISELTKKQIIQEIISFEYDVIHLFRLELSFLIPPLREHCRFAAVHLDLDDFESANWERIKEIYRLNGEYVEARKAGLREEAHKQLEKKILPSFDRVYVCSELDKKKIESIYQLRTIHCLPNVYPSKDLVRDIGKKEQQQGVRSFCYIWVGSWGYYPNQDSLLYFYREILPLLRKKHFKPFVVQVIGQGWLPKKVLRKLMAAEEIIYIGKVDRLGHYYQEADAAIVPLRAGGGTRLKVIEAFAYGVPVVSTSIGVEGLEVDHGKHALVADSPSDFAAQCLRLSTDVNLRNLLIENAASLLKEKYSPERLQAILCSGD